MFAFNSLDPGCTGSAQRGMDGVKCRSSAVGCVHALSFMTGEALTAKAEAEASLLEH
ncbi:hypothetical protein [Stenotrophomonas sepilia]|uniref:hypothetical protein n=1 Tax=Stenotrophomonas sepilia TaxID=2860290 RepID=UPI003340AA0C